MYHKEIEAKYILLGTVNTGKSSFIHRVQYGSYPTSNQTTIGIDYASLNKYKSHDDLEIKYRLNFWDAGGHISYMNVIRSFYRRVTGALIFFDVNSQDSFKLAIDYYNDFKKFDDTNKQFYFIGNKIDKEKRAVYEDEVLDFIDDKNIKYYECSVLLNKNIDLILDAILDNLQEDLINGYLIPSLNNGLKIHYNTMPVSRSTVSLNNNKNNKNCCIIN